LRLIKIGFPDINFPRAGFVLNYFMPYILAAQNQAEIPYNTQYALLNANAVRE